MIYDAAGRITALNDPSNAVNNQTYGYDALDRLTSWMDNASVRAYDYDATGNRTSVAIGGNSYPYTVAANSNRLTATAGPAPAHTFTYDGAGNITSDGLNSFTYNDRGRLVSANAVSYVYDGLGQRVKKNGPGAIVPSGTHYYVYDEGGRLLGEYDANGTTLNEYVYLDDQVLAVMRGPNASPEVFYVYTDQVGRPWMVMDVANQVRWRWDTSPFGEFGANDNPAGVGAFTSNLRFPGQFFDRETNLHYNYFRDYDPQLGRYVQSDPIGLAGGVNTYGYVGGNPVSYSDPFGLFELPLLPQGLIDAATGFGDGIYSSITFGLGNLQDARDALGIDGGIAKSSSLYCGFEIAGNILGGAALGGAGASKAGINVWARRYPRAGGGGIGVDRFGKNLIRADWHRFKSHGHVVNRPHIDIPGVVKHWPW